MTDRQDKLDRNLALAAIALDGEQVATGEKPDFDELWDWAAGKVTGERELQIRSHVARDAQVYGLWREIRVAMAEKPLANTAVEGQVEEFSEPQIQSRAGHADSTLAGLWNTILGWLTPAQLGGGLATAAVLGIAISLGLNQGRQAPDDFWSDWQSPKSVETLQVDQSSIDESQAFLSGMAQQMRALSIPAVDPLGRDIPEHAPSCSTSDEPCSRRREFLAELGQLTVVSRLECLIGDSTDTERTQRVQEILVALEPDAAVARLISPVRSWASAENAAERCRAVSQLISRGLAGNSASGN